MPLTQRYASQPTLPAPPPGVGLAPSFSSWGRPWGSSLLARSQPNPAATPAPPGVIPATPTGIQRAANKAAGAPFEARQQRLMHAMALLTDAWSATKSASLTSSPAVL